MFPLKPDLCNVVIPEKKPLSLAMIDPTWCLAAMLSLIASQRNLS